MRLFFSLSVVVFVTACAGSDRSIDDAALVSEPCGETWLAFGRELNEQRFSPLRQIDTATVKGLKVDWFIDLTTEDAKGRAGQEISEIAVMPGFAVG